MTPINVKKFAKTLTPPLIWSLSRKLLLKDEARQHISFIYGFESWEEASRKISHSYADESILENVRNAALQVKIGNFSYERDGVLFDNVVPNWQLNYLLFINMFETSSKTLRVLDFGGGLGTTFYQFKNSVPIKDLDIKWIVVEQENFVKLGQREFTTSELSFSYSLSPELFNDEFVALALGVLQYLKEPFDYLQQIIDLEPNYILIDATPFSPSDESSFSIQLVPKSIQASEYVAHVFTWKQILDAFGSRYYLVNEWVCSEQPDPRNFYKGAIFRKKP